LRQNSVYSVYPGLRHAAPVLAVVRDGKGMCLQPHRP